MVKPSITSFSSLTSLDIQSYEHYLPTAFDESMTLLQKMNKLLQYMNEIGEVSNEVISKWNEVVSWVMGEGLSDKIDEVLTNMISDGTLDTIINTKIFGWVNVTHYGALGDGLNDDTTAIQTAINQSVTLGGGTVFFPYGTYKVSSTIVLPPNVRLKGVGRRLSTIIKASGMTADLIKTKDFDSLKGTTVDGQLMPTNFGILDLTLNGNYMKEDIIQEQFTSYVNTTGGGVKIYGRRFEIDCEIINMAGVGLWIEGNYTETSPLNETKDFDLRAEIRDCKEECFILKGLADGRIHQLWTRGGGRRIYNDQDSLPVLTTPNYVGYPYTDNIVFDNAGAEIDMIHTWGAYSGKGIRTIGSTRILANLIIAESCMSSGVQFNDGAYGQISNLKVHGCGGARTGSDPDIHILTTRPMNISSINHEARDVSTGQTALKVEGSFVTIPQVNINMFGRSGHAVDLGGNYNTVKGIVNNGTGVSADGLASAGIIRRSPFNDRTFNVDLMVIGFPVGFNSIGTAFYESIKIVADLKTGQNVFVGNIPDYGAPTKWDVIANADGVYKTTQFYGAVGFDPTNTDEQTLTINHTLVGSPALSKVLLTLQDTPSNVTNSLMYFLVSAVSDTTITVKVRMEVAQGADTSPKINVFAKI